MDPNYVRCTLCHGSDFDFIDETYLACKTCGGLLRHPKHWLSATDEKAFYLTHENDVHDEGYRRFVRPITDYIRAHFTPAHSGLDFGSGTGPVITQVLREQGYQIVTFDPFFDLQPDRLDASYHYIACCEVMEHFHDPHAELLALRERLEEGGQLVCMTYLYHEGIDFATWRYRRDPTHTFIYTQKSMEWIQRNLGFRSLEVDGRRVVFTR